MLSCQRDLFSLPEGPIYLNCAYMSPTLKASEAAGVAGLRRKNDPASIGPADFFAPVDALRELVGRLVNAGPERVAFVPSVSYGLALATRNVPLHTGQNVVVPDEEFPSNVYGWMERCREQGGELRLVPRPGDTARPGTVWSERMLEAIDARTAAVSITALHWADGTLFDLERIARRTREVGAFLVLDGTQSIGAVPFDFQKLQPDLLICAGYKWCLGPYSYGFAVLGDRLLEGRPLEDAWQHRAGSEDFSSLIHYTETLRSGGRRFDMGEQANLVAVPMLSEALRQILQWGVENIQAYCEALADDLRQALAASPYSLALKGQQGSHMFGIHVPGEGQVAAVLEALGRRGISVSQRGNAIRVSPHLYNRREDMAALAETLLSVGA
ncbi:MAG: aminotransferase class V-fold PLP-dependent enzyme [bacterium]